MNIPPTDADIASATDVRRRDAALHEWMQSRPKGQRNSYHHSEVPAHLLPLPTNEERSDCEVIEFLTQPLAYGKTYVAYLSTGEPRITTWMGDTLATVYHQRPRSFLARGIDGRHYYGRHNGSGVYCTLRLSKVSA